MKKKICDSSGNVDNFKPKERHIVSWSKEEDDILREQIRTHGTDNWTIIASKFDNKTTRQCRRRWFTYLNSDVKKGGWSPEEDMLLCEAQKMFGNRWTEIAKVVSGRTDNAVKNRFSVLRKRKAKHEESTKENNVYKRTSITVSGVSESVHPMKMRRKHIATTSEASNIEGLIGESITANKQLRPPLMVLMQNCNNTNTSPAQLHANSKKASLDDTSEVEPTSSEPIYPKSVVDGRNIGATNKDILPSTNEMNNDVGGVCPLPSSEFNSPLQVTPFFRSMAQCIPSPHFSESEKSFLLKTLGMESTPPDTTAGTSQSPPCKRALLHCL
uniref:transcription factor MYB88-like n=1 Tax=Erigeron canadensis TaxID=72917 RepID=UPI001CB98714|nr:transcription factor MYB88-like [Erigeron canadensis]